LAFYAGMEIESGSDANHNGANEISILKGEIFLPGTSKADEDDPCAALLYSVGKVFAFS
jgi:hypothetical protein